MGIVQMPPLDLELKNVKVCFFELGEVSVDF